MQSKRKRGWWMERGAQTGRYRFVRIRKLLSHGKRTRKRKVERPVSSLVSLSRAFYFWPWDAVKEEERTVNGARSTDRKTSICSYKEIAFSRQTYSETKSGEASLFSGLPEQGLLFLALRYSQRGREDGEWSEEHRPEDIRNMFV